MIVAYGDRPRKCVGKSFTRSIEPWSALWRYCEARHLDIVERVEVDEDDGGTLVLEFRDARALAARLAADIKEGIARDYVVSRDLIVRSLPRTACISCEGTGIRTDDVGTDLLMQTIELPLEQSLRLGRTRGWCNECSGEGIANAWEKRCELKVKDIAEFAKFLSASGGCRIY